MDDPTTYRRPRRFRTVLHGTCLLAGKHPPGSKMARECPVLRRARRQPLRGDSGPQKQEAAITLQGRPEGPSSAPDESGISKTIFRRGRAFRPGRPPVPLAEQRQRARQRDRAYRARRQAATIRHGTAPTGTGRL